jgi:deazaflavin-dependent oxidoreductase (nitroreductase family)
MPHDTPEITKKRDDSYRRTSGEHVARYLATDGVEGYDDNRHRAPTLLLTTIGRRSGREIVSPLYFAEHDGQYIIIASYAGSDTHPKWYLNLLDQPAVQVQIRGDRFAATARTASAEEKRSLWPLMGDAFPFYNDYLQATERDIPLVILERIAGTPPDAGER